MRTRSEDEERGCDCKMALLELPFLQLFLGFHFQAKVGITCKYALGKMTH